MIKNTKVHDLCFGVNVKMPFDIILGLILLVPLKNHLLSYLLFFPVILSVEDF